MQVKSGAGSDGVYRFDFEVTYMEVMFRTFNNTIYIRCYGTVKDPIQGGKDKHFGGHVTKQILFIPTTIDMAAVTDKASHLCSLLKYIYSNILKLSFLILGCWEPVYPKYVHKSLGGIFSWIILINVPPQLLVNWKATFARSGPCQMKITVSCYQVLNSSHTSSSDFA